jgi:hypothetical protein
MTMKFVIYPHGEPPVEIDGERIRIMCGNDHFELREQGGLLVRIEEHDGGLTLDLAVFPSGGNAIRLKGGLR